MIVKTNNPEAYRKLIRVLDKLGLYFQTLSKWTDKTHIIKIGKDNSDN